MQSAQIIRKTAAQGANGAVAAARLASAEAAQAMIDGGGNAVDAAVAAALVAGVVEPMETTLGGSGFMLIGTPDDGRVHSVEFGPRAPQRARPDMYKIDTTRNIDRGLGISVVMNDKNVQGITSAGVPATLRGLAAAHERFGLLPFAKVLGPAIDAAHNGFAADPYYALEALANFDALRLDPGAVATYLTDGQVAAVPHLGTASLGAAPMIRQPVLGRTLELIAAKGVDAFYDGELSARLLTTVRELGGLLEAADLQSCRPVITEARRLRFRDVDVWAPNAPCGALTQLQMLQIWQSLYPEGAPIDETPERLQHLAEASWHAFADRYHWLGDTDFVPVPEQALLSSAYADKIAAAIRAGHPAPRTHPGQASPWNHFAGHAAHDPWPFQPDGPATPPTWAPRGATEPTAGTTHISVIDRNGMSVSMTHTAANHFGAKVVCPRTGILFDAAMGWFNAMPNAANSIAGGKRPLANMGPMLLTREGAPVAAIGAPGGRRIISAVVQIALNLVERGMDAEEAVNAPRIDASGSELLASERLTAICRKSAAIAELLRPVDEQHAGFGYELARPIMAIRKPDGTVQAAADPFSRGYALAC